MNYPTWLASLSEQQRNEWNAIATSAPIEVVEDWAKDHGCSDLLAYLASCLAYTDTVEFRASDHREWEQAGLDTIMERHEVEYVNQEPDGFETLRGEWFVADDDTLTLIWGTFGNYNSPGSTHHTYGTVYATLEGYRAALAEWEGKSEYLEADEDDVWESDDDWDAGMGEDENEEDESIPY